MSEMDDVPPAAPPPPMDDAMRSLLRTTRSAFDGEASAHAGHAFERLALALPGLVTPPPTTPGSGGSGSGSGGGGGAAVATAGKVALTKLTVPILASLIVGGGIGAAVTHKLEPARERIVYIDRVVNAAPSASTASSSTTPAPAFRVEDLPTARASSSASSAQAHEAAASPASARIAAERLLLDDARSAFAAGDYEKALQLLHRHNEKFQGGGVLAEERDALTVRTLAALGRKSEAATASRAFVLKYPQSIMRSAVEAAAAAP